MDLLFQKATAQDFDAVSAMFACAIKSMDEAGIYQWDERYPNKQILREDIAKGQMYLGEIGGKIAAAFSLSRECDEEYETGQWEYKESPFFVVHRLCVNPDFQHRGVGRKAMLQIEEILIQQGIENIRLDAFSLNPFALKLYEKLGYRKVGEVKFRKGLFYLYEKKLDK